MARYRVYFETTASCTVEVDADDEDAALDKAHDEIPTGVCAQCSGWGQPWSLCFAEFEPIDDTDDIKAVEPIGGV